MKEAEELLSGFPFESGKLLCKKGHILLLTGDVSAAHAALSAAEAIRDKLCLSASSELSLGILRLRLLLSEEP